MNRAVETGSRLSISTRCRQQELRRVIATIGCDLRISQARRPTKSQCLTSQHSAAWPVQFRRSLSSTQQARPVPSISSEPDQSVSAPQGSTNSPNAEDLFLWALRNAVREVTDIGDVPVSALSVSEKEKLLPLAGAYGHDGVGGWVIERRLKLEEDKTQEPESYELGTESESPDASSHDPTIARGSAKRAELTSQNGALPAEHLAYMKKLQDLETGATLASHRKRYKSLRQHVERYKESEESLNGVWHTIFKRLQSMTHKDPSYYMYVREVVKLPEGVTFQHARDDPMLSHREIFLRTGCHFDTARLSPRDSSFRSFYLRGHGGQRQAAMELIRKSSLFSATIQHTPIRSVTSKLLANDAIQSPPLSLKVISSDRNDRHRPARKSEHLIEALEQAKGQDALNVSRLDELMSLFRANAKNSRSHESSKTRKYSDRAAKALVDILTKPTNVAAVTAYHLHDAFSYLLQTSQYSLVNHIFWTYEGLCADANIPSAINTAVFDLMIKEALKRCDIRRVLSLVIAMSRRNLIASHETWLAFYRLTQQWYPDRTAEVKRVMDEGPLHERSEAYSRSWFLDVPERLDSLLAAQSENMAVTNGSVKELLDDIRRQSPHMTFIPIGTASLLVRQLVIEELWEAAIHVAKQTDSDKAGIALFPTLLRLYSKGDPGASKTPTPGDIIKILYHLEQRKGFDRTRLIQIYLQGDNPFSTLFAFAIATRSWQLARAVWTQARIMGRATTEMTNRIRTDQEFVSSGRGKRLSSPQQAALWTKKFPKFVLGADFSGVFPATSPARLEQYPTTIEHLRTYSIADHFQHAWNVDCSLAEQGIWPPKSDMTGVQILEALNAVADAYVAGLRPGEVLHFTPDKWMLRTDEDNAKRKAVRPLVRRQLTNS